MTDLRSTLLTECIKAVDWGGRWIQPERKAVEGRVSRSERFCCCWWWDGRLEQRAAAAMQQAVPRRSVALIEHHTRRPNKSTSPYSHTGTLCAFIIHEPQMNNISAAINRLPSIESGTNLSSEDAICDLCSPGGLLISAGMKNALLFIPAPTLNLTTITMWN